jgi:glutaredoxin
MTGGIFHPVEAEVRLYTRSGCHLCDEAKRELRKLQKRVPFEFSEIDIDQDAVLRERYNDEVPVIFIHGRKTFKYRIEPREFSRILRQGPEDPWTADAVQPERNPGSLCD